MVQIGKLNLINGAAEAVIGIDGNESVVFILKIINFYKIRIFLLGIKNNGFFVLVHIKIIYNKRRAIESVFRGGKAVIFIDELFKRILQALIFTRKLGRTKQIIKGGKSERTAAERYKNRNNTWKSQKAFQSLHQNHSFLNYQNRLKYTHSNSHYIITHRVSLLQHKK